VEKDWDLSLQNVFIGFSLFDIFRRTFTQMDSEAESFGRGLRELGLKAKENVVLFAETRAEWLIAANGCMKQNMPLVKLFVNCAFYLKFVFLIF